MKISITGITSRLIYAVIFLMMVTASGCGSAVKGKSHYKIKKFSCSMEQLVGDDTYFYSDRYQRKLKKCISRRTLFH